MNPSLVLLVVGAKSIELPSLGVFAIIRISANVPLFCA